VDEAVLVQQAAAPGCSVSSSFWRQLRVVVLLPSRSLLLDTAAVHAHGSDARLPARVPRCHVPGGQWTVGPAVSIQRAAAAADCVSSLWTHCVRAVLLLLSRRVALDVVSVDVPVVCPSVVDAPPCSPTVLSCGWWSANVDAAVPVQRAAAVADYVPSLSWCCLRAVILATVSMCLARRCLSQRSSVRRSWMRLPACPPCCQGGWWSGGRGCGCGSPAYSCHDQILVPLVLLSSSLPRSTSVHPSVVDGSSSLPPACSPDNSCTLLID
jgi:hypothetical protein